MKPNVDYKSAPFYAVVLKREAADTNAECDQGEFSFTIERERRGIQKQFPGRKVVADNHCPDMSPVSYIVDGEKNTAPLLAIYGWERRWTEAKHILAEVKGDYRGASIKRMRVIYNRIVQ